MCCYLCTENKTYSTRECPKLNAPYLWYTISQLNELSLYSFCIFLSLFVCAANRNQKAAPWISRRSSQASLPMLISWREGKDLKKGMRPRVASGTKLIWDFICLSILSSPAKRVLFLVLSLSFLIYLPCAALFTCCMVRFPSSYPNPHPHWNKTHSRTTLRFSSGDLSSEVDDVDPNSLPPAARPIQDQPTKPPPHAAGGPPNMPPPPAPGQLPPQPAGAAPDLSLSFGAGKAPAAAAPAPPRGVSAPTSPAKSRESLLQRVQSLTGAARDQGASILGMLWPQIRQNNTNTRCCVCAPRAQFQAPRRASSQFVMFSISVSASVSVLYSSNHASLGKLLHIILV